MRKIFPASVIFLWALSVNAALAVPQTVVPQPDEEPSQIMQQTASFDGVWEGTINFDKEAFLSSTGTPTTGVRYRLEISDPVIRVFLNQDGKFVELKAGIFHITAVETNAVIFATEAAPDAWVESVVFTATQKDANTLIVELARVVNNRSLPLSDKESKYATRGAGEFARATQPVVH